MLGALRSLARSLALNAARPGPAGGGRSWERARPSEGRGRPSCPAGARAVPMAPGPLPSPRFGSVDLLGPEIVPQLDKVTQLSPSASGLSFRFPGDWGSTSQPQASLRAGVAFVWEEALPLSWGSVSRTPRSPLLCCPPLLVSSLAVGRGESQVVCFKGIPRPDPSHGLPTWY